MCKGFGVIVTKDGRYLFCEPDTNGDVSHSNILSRAGIKENTDQFNRAFVRVEIPTWDIRSFRFDEEDTLPGWVDEDEVKNRCNKLLKRVYPAWAECEKVCDTAWAECEKVCDPAWAEYDKVCDTARAKYEKVRDTARAKYDKVCDTARAKYVKVCDTARAEMVTKISSIDGYVRA